jgi:ABC-2 type transport system permease protein
MSLSRRRILAIIRKELRSYRRNRSIVAGMAILPAIFLVQPLVSLFALSSSAAANLRHHHELLYLLGIPALVPATLAAYAIVGERQENTLEPVLGTPIRREEMVLGKAPAVFGPSVAIAYVVFAAFLAMVALFADADVAHSLIRGPDILAQVIFTPLIAGWSIWMGIALSTRVSEVRVAQQLGVLVGLPTVAITTLISLNTIHATAGLAFALAAALLIGNRFGWRLVSRLFDRERLITGTK